VPAHRFDEAQLAAWMAPTSRLPGPLNVQQFQGGASNPTFLLTDATGHRYVLRKKPPGQLLSRAHQVDREYRA
jgi:aminoglycoside phosphotransferase (APT) family kinase protein